MLDLPSIKYLKDKDEKEKPKPKKSDIEEAARLNREAGERIRAAREQAKVQRVKMSDVLQNKI